MVKTIGVLALQGAFQAHQKHIEAAGLIYRPIRKPEDFLGLAGLILPGGESSTMLRLLKVLGMEAALEQALKTTPTWGICAGSILMCREVLEMQQKSFGVLDIAVKRNAYGRQAESFCSLIGGYEVAFIRAPIIDSVNPNKVEVLAHVGNHPVWVTQGHHMATTFHPELNPQTPSPMHRYFFDRLL